MRKIKNKISYLNGYKITIRNAKNLSKIADKSADDNKFGIACSLNILAAEEGIKAVFMLIKHFNEGSEIDKFDKIFSSHKIKHENLLNFFVANQVSLKIQTETLHNYQPILKTVDDLPQQQNIEIKKKFGLLYDHVDRVKRQLQKQIPLETIKKWLSDANNEKNRGFYVDKSDSKWYDPNDFTKIKYEEERKYTQSFIDDAEAMLEIFDNSSLKALIATLQNT